MKTTTTRSDNGGFSMARHGKNLSEMDRSFDIEYWQRRGDEAIFDAARELVEFYLREKGADPDEFRLQRSVEHFQRERG